MKFFRLRLPARGPTAAPLFTRARLRSYLIGLGLLLVAFVVGIYLFFPTRALQERIEREAAKGAVTLTMSDLDLLFPPGLRGTEVTVQVAPSYRQSFEINRVAVRPLWSTLFGTDPGIAFQAQLLGGELAGQARKRGSVVAQARGITFAERPITGSLIEVAGTLTTGQFTGAVPLTAGTDSRLELTLDQARINGMEGLGVANGTLNIGQIVLRGEGKGNAFRIDELEARGGDLQLSGSGSLLVGQPFERSRLNLNLILTPATGIDPALRDLLELFATAGTDGSYRLRLGGTLASPIFAK
ncbi:MAG: type II secretion system protein GspN [Desulfuromonadales bacterium]|nr:type II secretion system protein GspN [Desulfuromonadales bacterium]